MFGDLNFVIIRKKRRIIISYMAPKGASKFSSSTKLLKSSTLTQEERENIEEVERKMGENMENKMG